MGRYFLFADKILCFQHLNRATQRKPNYDNERTTVHRVFLIETLLRVKQIVPKSRSKKVFKRLVFVAGPSIASSSAVIAFFILFVVRWHLKCPNALGPTNRWLSVVCTVSLLSISNRPETKTKYIQTKTIVYVRTYLMWALNFI